MIQLPKINKEDITADFMLIWAEIDFNKGHKPKLSMFVPNLNWKEKAKGYFNYAKYMYNYYIKLLVKKLQII